MRRLRIDGGWTQQELAERAGISVEAVATLERGTRRSPRRDTLDRLADALDLSGEDRIRFLTVGHRPPATDGAVITANAPSRLSGSAREAGKRRWWIAAVALAVALASMTILFWHGVHGSANGDATGRLHLVASWTDPLTRTVALRQPRAVATDRSDHAYILDSRLDLVAKLSPDGHLLAEFGSPGAGPGQFHDPRGIAAAPGGRIYVADAGNHRVQILNPSGQFLSQWSGWANRPARTERPVALAVDPSGRMVCVADAGIKRLLCFDARGNLLWQRAMDVWSVAINRPHGIIALGRPSGGPEGSIQARVYSPHGHLDVTLSPADEQATWPDPRSVATDLSGSLLVGMGPNGLDVDTGNSISVVPFPWRLRAVDGLAVDSQQRAYVADAAAHAVYLMSLTGQPIARFAILAPASIQRWTPEGIVAEARGAVYVADSSAPLLEELDSTGRLVRSWYFASNETGMLTSPRDVAGTEDGHVLVFDPPEGMVLITDGRYLDEWRHMEAVPARAIAAARGGPVYAVIGQFIQEFTASGQYISAILAPAVRGIAVDAAGNIYVARGTRPAQKLAPDGRVLASYPTRGASLDLIAVGPHNAIYALDRARGRLYALSSGAAVSVTIRGLSRSAESFKRPNGIAVDGNAYVYISDTGNGRVEVFGAG